MRVTKLVEATNGHSLVEAENAYVMILLGGCREIDSPIAPFLSYFSIMINIK